MGSWLSHLALPDCAHKFSPCLCVSLFTGRWWNTKAGAFLKHRVDNHGNWCLELLAPRSIGLYFSQWGPGSILSVYSIIKYHSFTICFGLLNESKAGIVTSFPSELYLLVIKQCYWAASFLSVAKSASFPFYNCAIRVSALLSYISRTWEWVNQSGRVRGKGEGITCSQTTQMHLIFINNQILQNGKLFIMIHFRPLAIHTLPGSCDFCYDLVLYGWGSNLFIIIADLHDSE